MHFLYGSVCSNVEVSKNYPNRLIVLREFWLIYDRIHTDPDKSEELSKNTEMKVIMAPT